MKSGPKGSRPKALSSRRRRGTRGWPRVATVFRQDMPHRTRCPTRMVQATLPSSPFVSPGTWYVSVPPEFFHPTTTHHQADLHGRPSLAYCACSFSPNIWRATPDTARPCDLPDRQSAGAAVPAGTSLCVLQEVPLWRAVLRRSCCDVLRVNSEPIHENAI
jgi:hypothetical protein